MELKDVILSTLAEMEDEDEAQVANPLATQESPVQIQNQEISEKEVFLEAKEDTTAPVESEVLYLNSIKERLLVLFEGFQAPNNTNIEAKVDMTLNFLEYTLATIDSRITLLEKGEK